MRSWKKVISILLVHAFLLSSVTTGVMPSAFAAAPDKASSIIEATTTPDSIVIPKDYGMIKSKFTGKSDKLIVHIQDAHCNYEAQSNIANIIENLVKNNGLSLVSVEGADGMIDTSWFKAFPDAEVRKEVANYFMKKGEITGPELLSITTDLPIKLFGAETREYYIQNLNAFTTSYPLKGETEKYLNIIKSALIKLQELIYNSDLKSMTAKYNDYDTKKIQFNDYVRFLQEEAERHKINLRQYEDLFKLVNVLIYEKKIDFNVTDKERSALIDELSKAVSKDILTELVNKSIAFKVNKISSAEYYAYVRSLAQANKIDLMTKYPNLFNYIIYNSVYSRINNEGLFSDIKKLEIAIKEKLFENEDQRTLEKLSRHIDTLIGLVNIKLLNDDFDYYKAHKDEFTPEAFSDFIKAKTIQFGLAFEIDPPVDAVEKNISKLEDFYAIAIKRDKAMVDNTLEALRKTDSKIAVLVTGGFHSEGMTKLLEKDGISYIVVCPSITKDVPTQYIQILMNQRTSFEDILTAPKEAVKKSMLAPTPISYLNTLKKESPDEYTALINGVHSLITSPNERLANDIDGWIRVYFIKWVKARKMVLLNDDRFKRVSGDREFYRGLFEMAITESSRESVASAQARGVNYAAPEAVQEVIQVMASSAFTEALTEAFSNVDSSAPVIGVEQSKQSEQGAMMVGDEQELTKGQKNDVNLAIAEEFRIGTPRLMNDPDSASMGIEIYVIDRLQKFNKDLVAHPGHGGAYTTTRMSQGYITARPNRIYMSPYHYARYAGLTNFDNRRDLYDDNGRTVRQQLLAHEAYHLNNPRAIESDVEAQHGTTNVRKAFLETDETVAVSRTMHLDEVARRRGIEGAHKGYLARMWQQFFDRARGLDRTPRLKIIVDPASPAGPDTDPEGRGNYLLACMAQQGLPNDNVLDVADLTGDETNAAAAKNIFITVNPLGGGIGENLGRREFLSTITKVPIDQVVLGTKAADIGYYIKYPEQVKPVFVSIAELKLLQLVAKAKGNKFGGLRLQPIVNGESKKSYQDLLDVKICLPDSLIGGRRTYRNYLIDSGIIVVENESMLEQPDLPYIDTRDGFISMSDDKKLRQPGGHGQWGFYFLDDCRTTPTHTPESLADGKTHVRFFGNGEDMGSIPNEYIAGKMVKDNLPIVKVRTMATGIDYKGGKDGYKFVQTGEGLKPIPSQMELAEAIAAGQVREFFGAGLPDGIGREGEQPFNTNSFYINITLLTAIIDDLFARGLIDEDTFQNIIAPVLIPREKAVAGVVYAPIDGAFGLAVHNFNEWFELNPRAKDVLASHKVNTGSVLNFVDVPIANRAEFFAPIKKGYDLWLQGWSDFYKPMNTETWILENANEDDRRGPPGFEFNDAPFAENDEVNYWKETQNLINSFGHSSTKDLISLTINGRVSFEPSANDSPTNREIVLIGNVVIKDLNSYTATSENESRKPILLQNLIKTWILNYPEEAARFNFYRAGKFTLENVAINIKGETVTVTSYVPSQGERPEVAVDTMRRFMNLPGRVTVIAGTGFEASETVVLAALKSGKVTALKAPPGVYDEFMSEASSAKAIGVSPQFLAEAMSDLELNDEALRTAQETGILDPEKLGLDAEATKTLKVKLSSKINALLATNPTLNNAVKSFEKNKYTGLPDANQRVAIDGITMHANAHIIDVRVRTLDGRVIDVNLYGNTPIITNGVEILGVGDETKRVWETVIAQSAAVIVLGQAPVEIRKALESKSKDKVLEVKEPATIQALAEVDWKPTLLPSPPAGTEVSEGRSPGAIGGAGSTAATGADALLTDARKNILTELERKYGSEIARQKFENEIWPHIKDQVVPFQRLLVGISSNAIGGDRGIVILHDTNGDNDAENMFAHWAGLAIKHYLGDAGEVVRDVGEALVNRGEAACVAMEAKGKKVALIALTRTNTSLTPALESRLLEIINIRNEDLQTNDSLPINALLQVDDTDGGMSGLALYRAAVTIGFNMGPEEIVRCLSSMALTAAGQPITIAVMEEIKRGILIILRPMVPIINNIDDVRRAEAAALRSL